MVLEVKFQNQVYHNKNGHFFHHIFEIHTCVQTVCQYKQISVLKGKMKMYFSQRLDLIFPHTQFRMDDSILRKLSLHSMATQ